MSATSKTSTEGSGATARGPEKAGMVLGFIVAGIISAGYLAYSNGWIGGHAGPHKMLALGKARFTSCKYAGDFAGGTGFECEIENFSTEVRNVSNVTCAGFDDEERMIDSPEQVLPLYGSQMSPGERRVVRVYSPPNSTVAVCSETGDLGSPRRLDPLLPKLRAENLLSEFEL